MTSDKWKQIFREIFLRAQLPVSDPKFVTSFLIFTAAFGGCGIWASIILWKTDTVLPTLAGISISIETFLIAVISSALPEILYRATCKIFDNADFYIMVAGFVDLFLGAVVLTVTCFFPALSLWFPILLGLLTLLIWWLVHAKSDRFTTPSEPAAAIGGEMDKSLEGSLEGFKH
jgi:hypothetical protein